MSVTDAAVIGVQLERVEFGIRNASGSAITKGDLLQWDVAEFSGLTVGGADLAGVPGSLNADGDPAYGLAYGHAAVATAVPLGPYFIALEDIPDGADGQVLIKGRCQANVLVEESGSGAGSVGEKLVGPGSGLVSALHGDADAATRSLIVGWTLEAVDDEGDAQVVWIQFDGLHGFGVST